MPGATDAFGARTVERSGKLNQPPRDSVLRDPRRRKVNRLLGRAGPGLQQFHRDGCRIVDDAVSLETAVNALGNAAREIESGVRALLADLFLESTDAAKCPEECARCKGKIRHLGDSHREQIRRILAELHVADPEVERAWFGLTELAGLTHRRGLERARPLTQVHRDTWRRLEDLMAILLPHLEERLVSLLPRFRELAELSTPTKRDLKRFHRLPNTYRTRLEFIDNATPAWFPLLDDDGFFERTEDAFTWDIQESVVVPQHWPAVDFLVRVSRLPEHQERFAAVIERIDLPHEWAANELVAAMKQLPAAFAVRCAPRVARWVDTQPYVFFASRSIAQFAAQLAGANETGAAVNLLRALLILAPPSPEPGAALGDKDPVTKLREYEYGHVVTDGLVPAAQSGDAPAVLALAVELLDASLRYSTDDDDSHARRDRSTWWRPSVADDHGQYGHEYTNHLVTGALGVARAAAERNGARVGEVIEVLERTGWPMCQRIALRVLDEHPDLSLIRARLLDEALIAAGGAWPEFRGLLKNHFGVLSTEDRRRYVAAVESSAAASSEDDELMRRDSILRRLRPVAELLENDVLARYPELSREPREGTNDEGVELVRSGWVGNQPGRTADELRAMTDDEIVAYLGSWRPSGHFDAPTIEGQGEALKAAVAADPARFTASAIRFAGLDCTYVRAIIAGAYDALRAKSSAAVAWDALLDLAAWVLEQPAMTPRSSFSQDPDWTWTHKAIADIVHQGLGEIESQIPLERADQVWGLIAWLADHGGDAQPPRQSDSDDEAADEQDALMATLNSIRGEALQAAMSFVAWRWRAAGQTGPAFARESNAAALLERHLDHTRDTSLAARGAFGVRLPNLVALDAHWVRAHLSLFFPPEAPLIRALTWQAYIVWNRPYTGVRAVLTEEYRAAIDRLRARPHGRLDVGEKLAEHLMAFYLRGDLDIDSPDGLLRAFYERAPASVRGQATQFIGQVLRDNDADAITADHCARIRRLWEWRRAALGGHARDELREELESYGWWFASDKCDQEWLLDELIATLEVTGSIENDSLVMEKLVTIAPAQPEKAIRVVELMIESPKEHWLVQVWIDEIVKIVRAALGTSADAQARRLGARLVADNFDNGLIALLRPGPS